jgi:hypothetical protein
MTKKLCLTLLLLIASVFEVWAQHEADTWYFGEKAGFDFRNLTTSYACAVMSDAQTGQLLFYSNGEQVWDRTHQIMTNGDNLQGYSGATQGVLIVPVPGEAQRYYLFTLLQRVQPGSVLNDGGACQLFYSIVDMRLRAGLGDIVSTSKNVPLGNHLTEKLTAVRHPNGRDYWVLTHDWGSNTFLIYGLTSQGINDPVRQAIGPAHPTALADTALFRGLKGHLQASPNGQQLACAVTDGEQPFSLFDFDATTGRLANYVNLGLLRDAFGVSFSPDNSKLFVQNFSRTPSGLAYNIVSQFDVGVGTAAAIAASGQSIIADNPLTDISATQSDGSFYTLQNGPDGRLYGASWYRGPGAPPTDTGLQTFYVIDHPNARGFASGVHAQRFELGGRTAGPGLPNFLQHYFNGLEPSSGSICQLSSLELYPNPTRNTFQIQFPTDCSASYTLSIYNAVGQQVAAMNNVASSTVVDVATLAAGLYVVELYSAKQVIRQKLIKY